MQPAVADGEAPKAEAEKTSVRKKGRRFLWGAVIIAAVIAIMAGGYFIGKNNGTKQNPTQIAENENQGNSITETNEEEKVGADEDENKDKEQQLSESVTPTPEPVLTPTATVPPTEAPEGPAGKPIFTGYRVIDYNGCVLMVERTDGFSLAVDTIAATVCIAYEDHYLEFSYNKEIFGADIYFPEEVISAMAPIDGDEVILRLSETGINVHWAYNTNGQTEVYYDAMIPRQEVECIGKYTRYLSHSLKYYGSIATGENKWNPGKQDFEKVSDGKVMEVVYSGDNKENFALGLTYNHEEDILRMELYNYETESYLCGYAEGQIYYGEDTVFCLEPVFVEDGIYWEEIPYTLADGEKQYDLSAYDVFCEVKMQVTEEGITLYWSAYEYGHLTVFYDDFFEAGYMQREAYVKHY